MPRNERNNFNCVCCTKRVRPRDRKTVNKDICKYLQKKFLISAPNRSIICNRCRHVYRKERSKTASIHQRTQLSDTDSDDDFQHQEPLQTSKKPATQTSPPSIHLPISSTVKSHAYCFICKRPGPKLVVVPSDSRLSVFVEKNILIAEGNRCCPNHLQDGVLTPEALQNLKTTDHIFLNKHSVLDLLSKMRHLCQTNKSHRLNFDSRDDLSDEDYISLTGLSKENFHILFETVHDLIKNTPTRSSKTTLAIFLCKLNSGLSNRFLATLFNLTKSSLRRAVKTARQALMENFVPYHLGFQHVTREELIQDHTRPLAASLFGTSGKEAILVLDGTYIYIDKSSNFHFQRRSYNVHKGRPLLKPMVIVSTSGYFVSVLGPYLADSKNNDSSILNHIIRTNAEDIQKWIQEDDIFIVDRGFRDAIPLLQDLGIQAEMPKFMIKGQKQLSTEDANSSRLVTKVRWVVESANARIKRWKYLEKVLPTNQIPYIGDYVRIICAISNRFLPPLSSAQEDDSAVAARMLQLSHQVNSLKERVEAEELDGRKSSVWIDASTVHDFPKLTEQQLREMTCGSYQLKLSRCYIKEHIDGNHDILIHREDRHLLKVKMQSRHVSSKAHILWISFNETEVTAWYCRCKTGARVVGVCAHIAAVLWYLGYARHIQDSKNIGVRNWAEYVEDAANVPEVIDTSDSDDSIIEE